LLHTRETTVNKNIYFKEARKGPVFQGNCWFSFPPTEATC
jgi:hypothetical protein